MGQGPADPQIWTDSLRVMKPGAHGVVFSSVRLMHRLMVALEDSGFAIRDVIFWAYLNGMPKSRDISLGIDRELGCESEVVGEYQYVQGYRKPGCRPSDTQEPCLRWPTLRRLPRCARPKRKLRPASLQGKRYRGAGLGIKPAYEPIILVQKPRAAGLTVGAERVEVRNREHSILEETRIPLAADESPVGHNPHPRGRVCANQLRTEPLQDGYDKFFMIPKVRQHKEAFNHHPTLKPVELMEHLVSLVSFEEQTILDPFAGSGGTGVAALQRKRHFVGYEKDSTYYEIMNKRLQQAFVQQ